MPNSRQPTYDWPTHWPRMKDLYDRGHTIPAIHKAIQCPPNFEPSQRAVYDRFRLEGYSTKHGRSKPLHKDVEAGRHSLHRQSLPGIIPENSAPKAAECVLIEDVAETAAPEPSNTDNISIQSEEFSHDRTHGSNVPLPLLVPQENLTESLAPPSTLDRTKSTGKHLRHDRTFNSAAELRNSVSAHDLPKNPLLEESETRRKLERKKRENDTIINNLADCGFLDKADVERPTSSHHTGGRTKHPYRPKAPATPSLTRSKTPIPKFSSLLRKKDSTSKARAEQNSPFADSDSGYHSGRGTPSTLRDSLVSYPESSAEFRRLYRVACHMLHEPEHPKQHRETQSCQSCGCSSIHILAWSAKHFKLHEFKAELESMDLQDIQALDKAGNSALHYAAISGASHAHLRLLIDAGVPIYKRNTADQYFLHCLRRCDAGTESGSLDCYQHGLVNLLESIDLEKIFGQQDNDGQTILHAFALQIVEPELRDKTFKLFRDHGCSVSILDRFGKSPKDLWPLDYRVGQTMYAAETFNKIDRSPRDLESSGMSIWEKDVLRQMDAGNVLMFEARNNPHYVDGTTKDTVLHALSIVKMSSHEIIKLLREFVVKGVNLNRHNRDGHHPLAAFICNQSFRGRETGATMAKYIDILLGKGGNHGGRSERRDSSNINVNMMSRDGATALYEAAVRAQSDTVRSLIEAGANVNARMNNDPRGPSVLQATFAARDKAVLSNDQIRMHMFREVISHLEHEGAAAYPTSLQERGRTT